MKSKTSLWNKALFKYFSGSVFWLSLIYLIVSIVSLPLPIWMISENRLVAGINSGLTEEATLSELVVLHIIFSIIYVMLMVLFMFNYKNNEDASDFIHSLPVKRYSIFTHALFVGFLYMTLPVLITGVILFFVRYAVIFNITAPETGLWFVFTLFVLYTVFAVSVFAGVLVNKIFVHLQMIIVVLFLPVAFWALTVFTGGLYFEGIPMTSPLHYTSPLIEAVIDNTFPIFAVQQILNGYDGWHILIWTVSVVIITIFSYILYEKRKNEYVHQTFTYRWFQDILTAVISIIGMMAFGILMSTMFDTGLFAQGIFYIVGFIVSYFIVEMLFQGSLKIIFSLRTVLTSVISVIIFWSLFFAGWHYYVNKLPDRSDIESVYVETFGLDNYNVNFTYYYEDAREYFEDNFFFIKDEAFIDAVYGIHEYAVDHTSSIQFDNESEDPYVTTDVPEPVTYEFNVTYELRDGSSMSREFYTFLEDDSTAQNMITQLNSYNLVVDQDMIMNIKDTEDLTHVVISSSFTGESIEFENNADISRFVTEYKAELEELKAGDPSLLMMNGNSPQMELEFDENYDYADNVSMYHPAVLEQILDQDIELSSFIGMNDERDMYMLELTDDEKSEFFRDYNSMGWQRILEEYDLTELSDSEKEDAIDTVNNGELDSSGAKLLFYDINRSGDMPYDEAPSPYQYPAIGIE